MTSSLGVRKRVEVERKLGSIRDELARWRERSRPGQPHEKHHTQIERIGRYLDVLLTANEDLWEDVEPEELLGRWRAAEATLLVAHRIWDFFREKLGQRLDPEHRAFLRLADELAWSAYEPAQRAYVPPAGEGDPVAAVRARREPPLLFFSGRLSPFALSRNRPYRIEGLGIEQGRTVRSMLETLPVPVIGVPWSQAAHLPDALVIGHETGHAVEADFGLGETLAAHLRAGLEKAEETHAGALAREPAWRAWLHEVFADLYGCLVLGPAFVGALADFLAVDAEAIADERPRAPAWGEYPSAYLRILVCCAAVERMGFAAEAETRRKAWRESYPEHAMSEYEAEIPAFVEALLTEPCPTLRGRSVMQVIAFTPEQQGKVAQAVADLELGLVEERDPRVLFAAARVAFEKDPAAFPRAEERIRRQLARLIAPGTRGTRFSATAPGAGEDRAAAEELARRLPSS